METKGAEISNSEQLEIIIERMKAAGPDKLHILADFDCTLTQAFVDGSPLPSMVAVLRKGNFLTSEYPALAHALYNHYITLAMDPELPLEQKKAAMEEWWIKTFKLLIDSGLTKSKVKEAVDSGMVKFRPGALDFIKTLHEKNAPLVIMSASPLGGEAIRDCLKKEEHYRDNIHIICNSFIWDEEGKATGVAEPIIHSMNKDETLIQNYPVFDAVKDRPNVILLGDVPGDTGMVEGFEYDNLIKIGFLNENKEKFLKTYRENFDIIITDDGPFDCVNDLLKKILN